MTELNNIVQKLEEKLRYQWDKTNKAKSQAEIQALRAAALETYRTLKKTKIQLNIK